MKMNEDRMGARWEGGGGVSWAQFFRKSVGHMAPLTGGMEKGGEQWPRKWHVLWFYNANG